MPPIESKEPQSILQRRVVKIIFLSLLLDLLAFTMPLPLFPRLIASFVEAEKSQGHTSLLSWTLNKIRASRTILPSWKAKDSGYWDVARSSKWDVTILGGILGSIFSFCQFLISPLIGRLSDKHGRRPILLLTMIGNILSTILWLVSTSFGTYLSSRAVAGLSEGNVQLSIAVISDVSDPATRAKSLALVGIAFSLCFTFGPMLGAWFATRGLPREAAELVGVGLNVYAVPAVISLSLLVVETIYLAIALPETKQLDSPTPSEKQQHPIINSSAGETGGPSDAGQSLEMRQKRLDILARIHTTFLFFFSGAEFTLTFLTYDLYGFTNAQNGRLLGFIGILSSLLQGGYTRRSKKPPISFVKSGIKACIISLTLLSLLPHLSPEAGDGDEGEIDDLSSAILYSAAAALAYVSASVVNSLNTLASLQCDEDHQTGGGSATLGRGKALGDFRSAGQLGRAFGPLFATGLYWTKGPTVCYGICAIGSLTVLLLANQFTARTSPTSKPLPHKTL